jgi:hypothetical protein
MIMNFKRLIPTLVIIFSVSGLMGQSNTMYYLSGVPQAYYLNPATQPQSNFFMGLPALGSVYVETYGSSIGFSDLVWNDPSGGLVLHPFHPDAGMETFLQKFEEENTFSANFDFSPVSFGFRVRKMYFTLDIVSRLSQSISFAGDIVDLAVAGNADSTLYDFSSMGFNITDHLEIALGISRKFGSMITVGIRPKLLFGVASLSSGNNHVSLYTSHDVWQFDSHLEMQVATPGFIIPTDESGTFDPTGEFRFDSTLTQPSQYASIATGNKGFGIDVGINIKPMDELTLSASVIDLGFIKWNNYIHTAVLEGSFEYTGIEYSLDDVQQPEEDTSDFMQYLIDTLTGNFEVSGSSDPFNTRLEPKIYIGASYSILRKLDVGLLARFDLPETGLESNLMLHANWHPSTFFGLSASYSPFGGRSSTFGLGMSLRIGPGSFYAVADYNALKYNLYKYENIPVFLTSDARERFNLRFGANFVLGWNQRKKLMKDKPMYYSDDY